MAFPGLTERVSKEGLLPFPGLVLTNREHLCTVTCFQKIKRPEGPYETLRGRREASTRRTYCTRVCTDRPAESNTGGPCPEQIQVLRLPDLPTNTA